MSANITTLTEENEEIVLPLLTTITPGGDLNQGEKNNEIEIPLEKDRYQSSIISFDKINYMIGNETIKSNRWFQCQTKTYPFCKSIPSKQILTDVEGVFQPGMNAILGPTGCGKSTLLDILADRKDNRGLSGNVFVSGQPRPAHFKYLIGYVIQDDLISETLTVRENLLFSANIRLSHSIQMNERIDRVNQVMDELDLQSCANTLIGTDFVRGVSGGEKKRTSIGMELVLSPNILFLDEPTTGKSFDASIQLSFSMRGIGLDASTAQNVMACLHRLSKQGRTIIFSIHQPRYSIFKLFDTVLFLSAGRNIYLGSPMDVLPYFALHGFKCEDHNNPADFVLDILIKSSPKLETAYLHSKMHLNLSVVTKIPNEDPCLFTCDLSPGYIREFSYVAQRTFCHVLRNPALMTSQIVSVIIYGLFTGLIFNKLERTIEPGVYNRFGAIFFIISCQVLGSMSALEPLIKERALFIHENVSGYYRVSSFFLAKLMIDLPLVHMIPSIIYSILTFFLTGLSRSVEQFGIFFITNLMAKIFGSAMCYFVAASTSTFGVALVMVICGYVTMMLFSGFLIDLTSILPSLRWIQWLSVFRYASNVLAINEFKNLTLCHSSHSNICLISGETILFKRNINYSTSWDLWKNILALLFITLTFFLIAFIQLLRIQKFK